MASFTSAQGAALNGIAFDQSSHWIFVTGKLWPKLFEIKLKRNKTRRNYFLELSGE